MLFRELLEFIKGRHEDSSKIKGQGEFIVVFLNIMAYAYTKFQEIWQLWIPGQGSNIKKSPYTYDKMV